MYFSFKRLSLMSDRRLRILQFANFCFGRELRVGDIGEQGVANMQRDIVHVLTIRNQRIFGSACLFNVNSDPRWKSADNRRVDNNA
jgi:hypothetical protein